MVDLSDINARATLKPTDMVCGIPLVIGAKKGLPNFNEFAMQTQVLVERKLQFRRQFGLQYYSNSSNQPNVCA